jgi:hypothetical protein
MGIVATALSRKHPNMTKPAIHDIPGLTFDDLDTAALLFTGWRAFLLGPELRLLNS